MSRSKKADAIASPARGTGITSNSSNSSNTSSNSSSASVMTFDRPSASSAGGNNSSSNSNNTSTSYLISGDSAIDGTRERGFLRIVVSTDNHLGFMERDPVRCEDSFAAFEEVLANAKNYQADFILLAGDLFHENKPSRRTMYQTMALLKKYCYGSDPVYTEVLNDQTKNLKSNNGCVNFQDPFLSVSMPIFAIHGNHDDPSRDGGHPEALAALDLLAVNNALNYFGKAERVDDIEVIPILLRKDNNYIAIYGLGAIRDERLNRMWTEKKVKFIRPKQEVGAPQFFNIFIVHQNRDLGRGRKNCIQESMIPEWMDMVIWGNEHQCHTTAEETLTGSFRIYQPGSSISTSLNETESSAFPKHFGILDVRDTSQYRLTARKYKQMRPFIYRNIALDTDHDSSNTKYGEIFNPKDPKVEDKVKAYLKFIIEEMMADTQDMVTEVEQSSSTDNQLHHVKDPHLVLLRLKVEKSDLLPTVNIQRFGAQFVGACANPSDILLYSSKKKEMEPTSSRKSAASSMAHGDDDENANQNIRIEELVSANLQKCLKSLTVLPEGEMANALEDYVRRKHANAFIDAVKETLENTQLELFRERGGQSAFSDPSKSGAAIIAEQAKKVKDRAEEKIKKGERIREERKMSDIVLSDEENNGNGMDVDNDSNGEGAKKAAPKARAKPQAKKASNDVDESPGRGGRGAGGRGGRGSAAAAASRGGASAGRGGGTARGGKAAASKQKKSMMSDEDSDVSDEDDIEEIRPAARSSGRAKAAVSYALNSDGEFDGDNISDGSEHFVASKGTTAAGGRGKAGASSSNSNSNSNGGKQSAAPSKSTNALGFPSQLLPSQGFGSSDNSLFAPSSNPSASQASSSGRRQLPSSFTAPTGKGAKKKSDDWE